MKRYGVRSTSAGVREVLRDVLAVLYVKNHMFERQRVRGFPRMQLTDRLSHRTTERRSR